MSEMCIECYVPNFSPRTPYPQQTCLSSFKIADGVEPVENLVSKEPCIFCNGETNHRIGRRSTHLTVALPTFLFAVPTDSGAKWTEERFNTMPRVTDVS